MTSLLFENEKESPKKLDFQIEIEEFTDDLDLKKECLNDNSEKIKANSIYYINKYKIEPFNEILDIRITKRNKIENIDFGNIYFNFFKNFKNKLCLNEFIEIIDEDDYIELYIDKESIILNNKISDKKFNHLICTSKLYCWNRSIEFYPSYLINTYEYNKLTNYIINNTSILKNNNFENIEYVD